MERLHRVPMCWDVKPVTTENLSLMPMCMYSQGTIWLLLQPLHKQLQQKRKCWILDLQGPCILPVYQSKHFSNFWNLKIIYGLIVSYSMKIYEPVSIHESSWVVTWALMNAKSIHEPSWVVTWALTNTKSVHESSWVATWALMSAKSIHEPSLVVTRALMNQKRIHESSWVVTWALMNEKGIHEPSWVVTWTPTNHFVLQPFWFFKGCGIIHRHCQPMVRLKRSGKADPAGKKRVRQKGGAEATSSALDLLQVWEKMLRRRRRKNKKKVKKHKKKKKKRRKWKKNQRSHQRQKAEAKEGEGVVTAVVATPAAKANNDDEDEKPLVPAAPEVTEDEKNKKEKPKEPKKKAKAKAKAKAREEEEEEEEDVELTPEILEQLQRKELQDAEEFWLKCSTRQQQLLWLKELGWETKPKDWSSFGWSMVPPSVQSLLTKWFNWRPVRASPMRRNGSPWPRFLKSMAKLSWNKESWVEAYRCGQAHLTQGFLSSKTWLARRLSQQKKQKQRQARVQAKKLGMSSSSWPALRLKDNWNWILCLMMRMKTQLSQAKLKMWKSLLCLGWATRWRRRTRQTWTGKHWTPLRLLQRWQKEKMNHHKIQSWHAGTSWRSIWENLAKRRPSRSRLNWGSTWSSWTPLPGQVCQCQPRKNFEFRSSSSSSRQTGHEGCNMLVRRLKSNHHSSLSILQRERRSGKSGTCKLCV